MNMMEKRFYEEPEFILTDVDLEDVITTSLGDDEETDEDESDKGWVGEWDTEL